MVIKEVIVVEGKDDASAVKKAVEAEVIITRGFAITKETLKRIETAQKRKGVIIFTDPDFAGEKIRKTISNKIKGCKHAFLPREEATKNNDIGIENASPENIRAALFKVRSLVSEKRQEFTNADLILNDLNGSENASKRRDKLGKILGIGYGNSKQFLNRLNNYGITREEFEDALKKL
ncbi:RNAse M5 [Caminicella sporogenes DSM 14501]|uniref:Ribonuclease M5 n=1 Tax=Caminicella sporogenes DSM 14501 TaxID=1121266 RepID=A0A1M6SFC6_9FIRM|nr:ribonuclease M5 [Caminicella sporogenes]RKD26640.1 ribonuclease M5 [Caminicella sporogenes]SHK43385.1 RNAse M5 [Caminicella sporogenes DSM 14501]